MWLSQSPRLKLHKRLIRTCTKFSREPKEKERETSNNNNNKNPLVSRLIQLSRVKKNTNSRAEHKKKSANTPLTSPPASVHMAAAGSDGSGGSRTHLSKKDIQALRWTNVAAALLDLPIHIVKCSNCGIVLYSVDAKIKYWCECKAVGIYGGMHKRKFLGEREFIMVPSMEEIEGALAADAGEDIRLNDYDLSHPQVSVSEMTPHHMALATEHIVFETQGRKPIQAVRIAFLNLVRQLKWSSEETIFWYSHLFSFMVKCAQCECIGYDSIIHPARANIWPRLVCEKAAKTQGAIVPTSAFTDRVAEFFTIMFGLAWDMYRKGSPTLVPKHSVKNSNDNNAYLASAASASVIPAHVSAAAASAVPMFPISSATDPPPFDLLQNEFDFFTKSATTKSATKSATRIKRCKVSDVLWDGRVFRVSFHFMMIPSDYVERYQSKAAAAGGSLPISHHPQNEWTDERSKSEDGEITITLETNAHVHPFHPPICRISGIPPKYIRFIPGLHGPYLCPTMLQSHFWNPDMHFVDFAYVLMDELRSWALRGGHVHTLELTTCSENGADKTKRIQSCELVDLFMQPQSTSSL